MLENKFLVGHFVSLMVAQYHYRPQRSCEGNVFTGVCLSTGGCLPQWMLGYPPEQTSPRQQTSPTEQMPPQSTHPPLGAHTPRADPREQTPPWEQTPPEQTPPRADTPPTKIRSLLRTVCILLECILVS